VIDDIHRFLRRTDAALCDELVSTAHGTAMVTPSLPLVWQLNAIFVSDTDADASALADEAERFQGHLSHRKLVVHDDALGARLAPELSAAGWNVFRLLVMIRRREPDKRPTDVPADEVGRDEGAAALAGFRREQPFGWQQEALRQLAEMDERYGRVCDARDFASPPDDPACSCRLYSDGSLAQIDEVGTLEARRGRGHATAAVLAALDAALADGRDPVFLLTDASDWPQRLYRRLGFDEIGRVYEFLKLPLGAPRP
jgi:ribosomal protein S18 acetylase RimI-like enzyme